MMPLDLRATVVPKSVDVEKRTCVITWTTGARVMRGGFFSDPYLEELSLEPKHVRMQRLKSGASPVLNAHSSYSLEDVIGVVESAELEGKRGTATVRFDTGVAAEDVFRKVADGIVRNWSVGYRIHKMVKVEDGEGKTPVYRAIDWEPYELSPVPIGADPGCVTRSANPSSNPCEFIEERTMDPVVETPAGAQPGATTPAAAPIAAPTPTADQVRAIVVAERERAEGIRRRGAALGQTPAQIATAIESGVRLDVFTAAAVDARAEAEHIPFDQRDPRIAAGEDARDKLIRGGSNWLLQRAGVANIIEQHAKLRGQTVDLDPGEFRGMTLIGLASECLQRAGVSTRGKTPIEIAGLAMSMRGAVGMATTGDFPVLLENTLHKELLAQYAITPDTWTQFCMTGAVSDFRPHKRYRRGSFASLGTVNEAGEIPVKAIPDGSKESITAATKGNRIYISRQTLVNDDMSAFTDLATGLGRAAKLSIEQDVYALLAANAGLGPLMQDGQTLFHATHLNLGTGAAISVASIDADRVVMASQKDPSNNEILDLRPAVLVIAIGLGGAARVINNSQYDVDPQANGRMMVPNKVVGLFGSIVDTARLTGTRRYLFAAPGIAPVLEVAFLNGQQQPRMETMQLWEQDGVGWRVLLDYAVGAIDFRGAITNAGV